MTTAKLDWQNVFSDLFFRAVDTYRRGHRQAHDLVGLEGRDFLRSIGYTEQEFFDFVEDFAKGGEPTLQTALDIAAVRRSYFLEEQRGVLSDKIIAVEELPSKDAEVEGIGWLPRILAKAEAKLRGQMPPELMYGCGGDRKFFRLNQVDPAEFLRQVWKADGDAEKVIAWVKTCVGRSLATSQIFRRNRDGFPILDLS